MRPLEAFEDFELKYRDLKYKINACLHKEDAEELEAFVNIKTKEKFEEIWSLILIRYDSLNQLYESFKESDTVEDRKYNLKTFFILTNPKEVIADLKESISFVELEIDYDRFITEMSKGLYGSLFVRYRLKEDVFNYLKRGLLSDLDRMIASIGKYVEQIGKHAYLLEQQRYKAEDRAFIKGGATALGLMLGIPFMGTTAGALFNHNNEQAIGQSIEKVVQKWDDYSQTLKSFLTDLEERYRYILLSIYGGSLLRINEQFRSINIRFWQLNLLEHTYELSLFEKEERLVNKWALTTIKDIQLLLSKGKTDEAMVMTNKFYHHILQNPVMKKVMIDEKNSLIYLANFYKFAALSKKAFEIKDRNEKEFLRFVNEIFKQMPLVINDEDMKSVSSVSALELVLNFIHISIKSQEYGSNFSYWNNLMDFYERMIKRAEKQELFYGELDEKTEGEPPYLELVKCMAYYLDDKYKVTHPLVKRFNYTYAPRKLLKKFKISYELLAGKDEFSKHLSNEATIKLFGAVLTGVLLPIRVSTFLLKILFGKKYWKITSVVLILGFSYYFLK